MPNNVNTIELAEKFTGELDQQIALKSVTGFMLDNAFGAKFKGAKTVHIPTLSLEALGSYDREAGYAKGSVTIENEPYTMRIERSREFEIDRETADESGVGSLAGETGKEMNKRHVVPEMDAYNIAACASVAMRESNSPIKLSDYDNAYDAFDELLTAVCDEVGDDEELVCFIDRNSWAALKKSPDFKQIVDVADFKSGTINRRVKRIDNCSLIPVPTARMFTGIELKDGRTEDQKFGGFTNAEGAKKVKMLMMPKSAACFVKKLEKTKIFTPDDNQDKDAWKFQLRLYYDCFIKKSNRDAIRVCYED